MWAAIAPSRALGRGRAHRSEAAGKRGHHAAPHLKVARDCGYFDPAYIERVEVFDSWYENPPYLPGRWYLQAICELFKENRLGLGRRLNLELIACTLYSLLAVESGDITTREQVFAAENLVGTPNGRIEKRLGPPADTSASSWARARSRRRGRRSRGG